MACRRIETLDHVNLHITLRGTRTLQYHLDGWHVFGSTSWEWFTDAPRGIVYALFPKGSITPTLVITVQTWDSDSSGKPRAISLPPDAYEFQGNPAAEKWIDQAILTNIP
jgi:hypothetical protein